jgi:pimeloyl-ACP methyl ester carboxylesterase
MSDVAELIDSAGCNSTILIGHDWGGIIAWYFAMRRVRRLERLVIMNAPHPAVFEREGRRWSQLKRSWYVLLFQIPGLPEALLRWRDCQPIADAFHRTAIDKSRFSEEVLRLYRDNAAQPGALTAMINYYRAIVRSGGRRQRKLGYPRIEVPTLMIWGEEDIALGKETTFGTDAYVRRLTLHYLPGVSHWVQQEAPEKVNEILGAWLRG